jgi:hypothetical protein
MRLTHLLPLLACLWAAKAVAVDAAPTRSASRLDVAADEVVARSYVPSPERRVGEVRLIRRGDANVVQTLLYTKLLRRVVGEIRQKELDNWPEGPGRADALGYIEALAAAQKQVWGRLLASEPVRDRRQKLWIEFVLTPDASLVAIGSFEMDESDGELRVLRRELLARLEPSRDYVLRNMRLIAADAFHAEGDALRSLLEPLELLRGVAQGSGG